jgi:hypothetical protein
MKAISIRAPWWWFILHGGKDIENRDWWTGYRGPVLIHASKWFRAQEVQDDFRYAQQIASMGLDLPSVTLRDLKSLGGYIVGQVEIVDCVKQSGSPWFFGKYGFVLRNPVSFTNPYPVKGALGLFEVGQALAHVGRDPQQTFPEATEA